MYSMFMEIIHCCGKGKYEQTMNYISVILNKNQNKIVHIQHNAKNAMTLRQ